ncbi:conserved hypothetical protein [Sphingomonas sp. EC-HK361]|uniref:hypothetical protein n=1 Tax=Sphingomonas sp. EC-HK361 TaxID=2038397 RepID=UPI001259E026|nr:hypothetical protein [Sphingomonas sp. EC-HK361]VVT23571.1 conserved hypothetical protein [Sphingomonas sp. EC-HK361]
MFEEPHPASPLPYVVDRGEVSTATALIAAHGEDAAFAAAAKADQARDIGNLVHFCRWRQIERLIVLMSADRAVGTVH